MMESLSEDASYGDGDLVELAYQYLSAKSYPAGCTDNKKRTIRKKAKRFEVRNGELCYKEKVKGKASSCLDSYFAPCVCFYSIN